MPIVHVTWVTPGTLDVRSSDAAQRLCPMPIVHVTRVTPGTLDVRHNDAAQR